MADILSLSKARKSKARSEMDATAEANRLKHGRTKTERATDKAVKSLADSALDAHKRDR